MNLETTGFAEITSEALKTYYTESFFWLYRSLKVMGRQVRERHGSSVNVTGRRSSLSFSQHSSEKIQEGRFRSL